MTWPFDAKNKIMGHYVYYWRVPSHIHVRKQSGLPDIAIIEYAPKVNRSYWLLATNGMSQFHLRKGDKTIGAEVFGCFQNNTAWNLELFTAIARYSSVHQSPVMNFDVLALTELAKESKLPYPYLLFGQALYEPETIGAIFLDSQNSVIVNQVFGIYDSELEYIRRFGAEALWNKMLASQMPDTLDIARQPLF